MMSQFRDRNCRQISYYLKTSLTLTVSEKQICNCTYSASPQTFCEMFAYLFVDPCTSTNTAPKRTKSPVILKNDVSKETKTHSNTFVITVTMYLQDTLSPLEGR